MIITPTSLTIAQLLGSANEQYAIPAYQRRYSWHEKHLWELIDDISLIEGSDRHLLGSIVCLSGHHVAGINKLELVDGQQRITTVSIVLQCIMDRLRREGQNNEAQDIERLLQAKEPTGLHIRKVSLDSLDSNEFDRLCAEKEIEHPENPNLVSAFSTVRKWVDDSQLDALKAFLYKLQNQAIIIRLDVSEAKDAFKLFETINNRGLRLSPTDIIKNFILGNAARFGQGALNYARLRWADLIHHLDGTIIDTFFRHYLSARLKRRITASYVIPNFKNLFMMQVAEAAELPERHSYAEPEELEDDPDEDSNGDDQQADHVDRGLRVTFVQFLDELVGSAMSYGQIILAKTGDSEIDRHLRHLRMIKSLQSYGFLMALRVGGCSDRDFKKILQLTEAFLLRRHICKERSNENETVFARLCGANCTFPLNEVVETYREYLPSDESFQEAFSNFTFNPNLIERARYCLEQFELDRHGKYPELIVGGPDVVQVEHIIPQKIKTKKAKDEFGDWPAYLGTKSETLHPQFVSRIGNLSLFAGPLNASASNNPYDRKKGAYRNSAIKITNSLPDDYPEFRFDQVAARSRKFGERAVYLWPIP